VPAETKLKEGAKRTRLRPNRWESFPCRGLVAPCQRATGSIKAQPLRCQRGEGETDSVFDWPFRST